MNNDVTDYFFKSCPLCGSEKVKSRFKSIEKDMSEKGHLYNGCHKCGSFYAADGTLQNLEAFYAKIPPYESASSKETIVERITRNLDINKSSNVLDIGCGSGAWAIPFLPYCSKITCVDTDAGAVAKLERNIPEEYENRAVCLAMDCDQYLDETNERFDFVLSMFSFEHQLHPVKFLRQLNRILSDNGKAIILVPSGDALQLKLLGNGFYWAQAPWHTFLPTRKGFAIAAQQAGFRNVHIYQPGNDYYSWFWLRGLSDKWGWRNTYNRLRKYRAFVKLDMALDKFFDRISFAVNKPSYRFYIISR